MENVKKMIPVLHHNHTGSVNIQNLNRRKERNLLLSTFSINDRLQTNRRGNNDIRSVKVWKVDDFFLFRKDFKTDSEEVILIVLIFLNFLFVLNDPMIQGSFFLFLSFDLNLILLSLNRLLIFHEFLLNVIKDGFGISNIRSDDEILCISKTFGLFILFQSFNTVALMVVQMIDHYFSKILDSLLFVVFNVDVVDVTFNYFLGSLVFSWLRILFILVFLDHFHIVFY